MLPVISKTCQLNNDNVSRCFFFFPDENLHSLRDRLQVTAERTDASTMGPGKWFSGTWLS